MWQFVESIWYKSHSLLDRLGRWWKTIKKYITRFQDDACGADMATRGSITRQKRSSRIITRRGEGYLIFVNFGTPLHYLGLYKQVHQKVEDHYEERREESKTCGDQEKWDWLTWTTGEIMIINQRWIEQLLNMDMIGRKDRWLASYAQLSYQDYVFS